MADVIYITENKGHHDDFLHVSNTSPHFSSSLIFCQSRVNLQDFCSYRRTKGKIVERVSGAKLCGKSYFDSFSHIYLDNWCPQKKSFKHKECLKGNKSAAVRYLMQPCE